MKVTFVANKMRHFLVPSAHALRREKELEVGSRFLLLDLMNTFFFSSTSFLLY